MSNLYDTVKELMSNPNVEAALYTLANAGPPPGRETSATPASLGLKDSE